ncbi:uncharacterized protein LOC121653125 isoform X2 [Melanotaenia boesemani]|uniref:uncharacterized protein LOC121634321 isoform X2 n=1 Tax=Melanotaenia boesemani TaxID=1250792 RepID=UPI001C05897E|nr:uncharacterized protein LOC121634321 isoform X2 [Melanotaenia boesemani]XP_041832799.1 uncharacterized protein LOC121634322 isoform X2 [Melanotaenia boesemani]XP_041862310.1 uncharacterized protein LOC121653125 isoform X2 [Melanotaenia boesemani]
MAEAQEQNSMLETAVRSFIQVLSNAQATGTPVQTGAHGGTRSNQPLNQQQASQAGSNVHREMQRSFPGFFQRRSVLRGKRPSPSDRVNSYGKRIDLNFCLLPENTTKSPQDEVELLQAGLGRRSLTISENADHDEISRVLTEVYPKMMNLSGGWLLYKAAGGSGRRKLTVLPQGSEGYTAKILKANTSNGKHMLYIIPLQEKLDVTPLPHDAKEFSTMPKSCCMKCGTTMPIQLLVGHINECVNEALSEDVEDVVEIDAATEDDKSTCPICGVEFPAIVLPRHASSCGESAPTDQAGTSGFSPSPSTSSWAAPDQTGPSSLSLSPSTSSRAPPDQTSWKNILCPKETAVLYRRQLLSEKETEPPIRASIDIRGDQISQSREILMFYKTPDVDWACALHCTLQGDPAVGVGVKRHFLSLAMSKLQNGFNVNTDLTNVTMLFEGEQNHLLPATSETLIESDLFVVAGRMIGHAFLHGGPPFYGLSEAIVHMLIYPGDIDTATVTIADVADYDIRDTIAMVDGEMDLTEEQTSDINTLAMSWDLPPVCTVNRRWLYQKLLKHAVIVRRYRQIKQMRKGLKQTKVLTLLQEKPETSTIVFPRSEEAIPDPQAILSLIVWPGEASEDSDDEAGGTRMKELTCGFLRRFIETASPSDLKQLMRFWLGWEIPSGKMTVQVVDRQHLLSSTCFATLSVPGHFKEYEDFANYVRRVIATTDTGFGLI